MPLPLALILITCLPWVGPVPGVDFLRPTPNFYEKGEPLHHVAIADLDEDGTPEVVTLQPPRVVIRDVDEWGVLREVASFPGQGHLLLFTDVDGDGHVDLLLGLSLTQIEIRWGNGSFAFSTGTPVPIARPSGQLHAADFDRNGVSDVLVTYGSAGTTQPAFSVLFGVQGQNPIRIDFESPGRTGFSGIGDIDGDGWLDIVGSSSAGLDFFYGAPGRSFVYGGRVATWPSSNVAVGDFDEDGRADVGFVAASLTYAGYVVAGRADRQSGAPELRVPDLRFARDGCSAADIDADGHVDLTFLGYSCHRAWGDGTGQFPERSDAGYDYSWARVAHGDLNGDGYLDVVGTRVDGAGNVGRLGVILSSGPRCAPFESFWPFPEGGKNVTAMSVDGARTRLAIGLSGGFDILETERWGHFEFVEHVAAVGLPRVVRSFDWDGDGTDELALIDAAGRRLRSLGRVEGEWAIVDDEDTGGDPQDLAVGDIDGNGADDIVVLDASTPALRVWTSDANGFLSPAGFTGLAGSGDELVLGDIDEDGMSEAAVVSTLAGHLTVLGGLVEGEWTTTSELSMPPGVRHPLFLDADGVAPLELVLLTGAEPRLTIVQFDSVRAIDSSYDLPLAHPPTEIVASDINHDGLVDLVVASESDSMITSYRGDGQGAFVLEESYPTAGPPHHLRLVDQDQDGWADVSWIDSAAGWGRSFWNVYQYVPVSALTITAQRIADGIRLAWDAGEPLFGSSFGVWREIRGGARVPILEQVPGGPRHWETLISGNAEETRGFWLSEVSRDGARTWHGPIPVPTANAGAARPLLTAGPSPFRERLTVGVVIPSHAAVRVEVFDVAGRRRALLLEGTEEPGTLSLSWNGRSLDGTRVPSGLYFVRAAVGDEVIVRRVICAR